MWIKVKSTDAHFDLLCVVVAVSYSCTVSQCVISIVERNWRILSHSHPPSATGSTSPISSSADAKCGKGNHSEANHNLCTIYAKQLTCLEMKPCPLVQTCAILK